MLFLAFSPVVIIRILTTQEEKANIHHQQSFNHHPQKDKVNLASRLPEPDQML